MAGFTPVEDMGRISMEPRERAEKVVMDFFREVRVGDQWITVLLVGLVEVVELMDGQEEEEEEGTLGEAVEVVVMIAVGEGVALTTMETNRRMNVVITRLVMVK